MARTGGLRPGTCVHHLALRRDVARNEDNRLLEQFGEEFRAYRHRVPIFIPRWGHRREFASLRRLAAEAPGHAPL